MLGSWYLQVLLLLMLILAPFTSYILNSYCNVGTSILISSFSLPSFLGFVKFMLFRYAVSLSRSLSHKPFPLSSPYGMVSACEPIHLRHHETIYSSEKI